MEQGTPVREVAIIGAGLSGIGAAAQLRAAGIEDVILLERDSDLGGTWRDNDYPGCVCDVPALLYSYGFAGSWDWSHVFAPQEEIRGYIFEIARRYGILPQIRYESEVESARWDPIDRCWQISAGGEPVRSRVLVAAAGPWSEPRYPDLPGLSRFEGEVFHSSRWNHGHPLQGARVAVIGTGASAVQFVPAIQPRVSGLAVFQRTPHWILPKPNPRLGPRRQSLLGHPIGRWVGRKVLFGGAELLGIAMRNPRLLTPLEALARAHLHAAVADPSLRQSLTPHFRIGCKQLILSNDWYRALTQTNVELIPHAAAAVTPTGVVDATGIEREADTIILGTGFAVTEPPIASRLFGRHGLSLAETWGGSPEGFLGSTVHGFPNLFFLLGPNASNGHSGAAVLSEIQIGYLVEAMRTIRALRLGSVEVRSDVQSRFNLEVQARLRGTVWNAGGCSSYYLDSNGRNSVMFPGSTLEFRRRLSRFDRSDYAVAPAAVAV